MAEETKDSGKTDEKKAKKDGFPFKVNEDGTVNIWSAKRAGRAVTGATGDIVKFDEKGFAKVKLDDALHFKDVPGFSFSEEK